MLHRFSVQHFWPLFDKCRRRPRQDTSACNDEPASMPLVDIPSTSVPIQTLSFVPSVPPIPSRSSKWIYGLTLIKSHCILIVAVLVGLLILSGLVVTKITGPTKLSLNYWAPESVTVEGQLICCNDGGTVCLPTPFVSVAIYDQQTLTAPKLIAETITNETGYFELSATTHVFYEFQPLLVVSHDCRMTKSSTPLMQRFKESFYEVPRDYVTKGGQVVGDGVYRLYPLMLHVPGVIEFNEAHCVFFECHPENVNPQSVKEQTQIYFDHNIFY